MIDINDLAFTINIAKDCFYNPFTDEYCVKVFPPDVVGYVYWGVDTKVLDTSFVEANYIPLPTYDSHPMLLEVFKQFQDTEPRYQEILQSEDAHELMAAYLDHGIDDREPYYAFQNLCKEESVRVAIQWCEENGFAYTYEKQTSEFDTMTPEELDDYLRELSAKVRKEEADRLGYDDWGDLP